MYFLNHTCSCWLFFSPVIFCLFWLGSSSRFLCLFPADLFSLSNMRVRLRGFLLQAAHFSSCSSGHGVNPFFSTLLSTVIFFLCHRPGKVCSEPFSHLNPLWFVTFFRPFVAFPHFFFFSASPESDAYNTNLLGFGPALSSCFSGFCFLPSPLV